MAAKVASSPLVKKKQQNVHEGDGDGDDDNDEEKQAREICEMLQPTFLK